MTPLHSVILFYSTNHAVWAKKILKDNGFKYKMIPIPRHLSSDCGYCIRIITSDVHEIKDLLNKKNIEYDRIEELF